MDLNLKTKFTLSVYAMRTLSSQGKKRQERIFRDVMVVELQKSAKNHDFLMVSKPPPSEMRGH